MRSLTGEMRYRCVCGSWIVPSNGGKDACLACGARWDRSCGMPTLVGLPRYMPVQPRDDDGATHRPLISIGCMAHTAIWLPVDWDAEAEG